MTGKSADSKWQKRWEGFCKTAVIAIGGVLLGLLWLGSVVFTARVSGVEEVTRFHRDSLLLHVAVIGVVTVLGAALWKQRQKVLDFIERHFHGLLLCVAAAYALWVLSVALWPIADQRSVLECAAGLLRGDVSPWEKGGYLYCYPNQNGLVVFYAGLQFLFGEGNVLAIQFLNVLAALASAVCFAGFLRRTAFLSRSKPMALLLLLYLPMMFYVTFAYGTIPGLLLAMLGLYCQVRYLENWNRWFLAASALCFTGAVLLKSNYLIFLVAAVITFLYHALRQKKWRCLVAALVLVVTNSLGSFALEAGLEQVTGQQIEKGVPTAAWVAMGVEESPRAPGWYSGKYSLQLFRENGYDTEKTAALASETIKERMGIFVQEPGYAVEFFAKKTASIWNEPTFQSLWIQQTRKPHQDFSRPVRSLLGEGGLLGRVYVKVFDIVQSLVYFFALCALVLGRKKLTFSQLMPILVFIGGFLFHLVWEAKGQYTVVYFFLLLPYAVKGLGILAEKLQGRLHLKAIPVLRKRKQTV